MSLENDINLQAKFQTSYPWINNILFQKILKKEFPTQDIAIKDYTLNAALSKGENYGSQMIRATVNYTINGKETQINFIIKTVASTTGLDEKMGKEMVDIVLKEIFVYDEVLPKVQKLFKEIGEECKLYGRCYATNRDNAYLIFEDLAAIGFKNVNRRHGLDIPHYKLVLSTVAKYHAATAMLIEKEPFIKESCNESITHSGASFLRKMITNFLVAKKEFCQIQPGLEKLAEKLSRVVDVMFDRICEAGVRNENDFNVILHGDLWSNNIMFKYDANGDVEDIVLVDFQLCYYGPPALDVAFNLYTSSHVNVSEMDWEMLIQYYYDELRAKLKAYNYSKKIPSLMQFHTDIITRGLYGAAVGVFGVATRNLENVGDDVLANFLNEGADASEYRLNMLLNPNITATVNKLLNYFDRRGYYDRD